MSNEGYHEPIDELSEKTRDMHRATYQSISNKKSMYINKAIIYGNLTKDPELKAILAHHRDEEKEHAAMVLEWIRRQDSRFDQELKDYLFTDQELGGHH